MTSPPGDTGRKTPAGSEPSRPSTGVSLVPRIAVKRSMPASSRGRVSPPRCSPTHSFNRTSSPAPGEYAEGSIQKSWARTGEETHASASASKRARTLASVRLTGRAGDRRLEVREGRVEEARIDVGAVGERERSRRGHRRRKQRTHRDAKLDVHDVVA